MLGHHVGFALTALAVTQTCNTYYALCFFGVNRSLNRTIASIRARILEPLRERCAKVDVYFHTCVE